MENWDSLYHRKKKYLNMWVHVERYSRYEFSCLISLIVINYLLSNARGWFKKAYVCFLLWKLFFFFVGKVPLLKVDNWFAVMVWLKKVQCPTRFFNWTQLWKIQTVHVKSKSFLICKYAIEGFFQSNMCELRIRQLYFMGA